MRLIFCLLISFFIFCSTDSWDNPYDPQYIGDYSFNPNFSSLPDTVCMFKEWAISCSTGADTFKTITLGLMNRIKIDSAVFWNGGEKILRFIFADTLSDSIEITAKTPNDRMITVKRNLVVVNPFRVEVKNAVYLDEMCLQLRLAIPWEMIFLPDSADSVIWTIGKSTDTLPWYSPKLYHMSDSTRRIIGADLYRKNGIFGGCIFDTIVAPYVDVPNIKAPSTITVRVGNVQIPVIYYDSLFTVDSIHYRVGQGKDEGIRTSSSFSDTVTFHCDSAGTCPITLWATNSRNLKSKTVTVILNSFIPDTTVPSITLIDNLDSMVIAASEYTIRFVAQDAYGITDVYATTPMHKHAAQRIAGDTFSVTVTDIMEREFFNVILTAVDSFNNDNSVKIRLIYESTLTDNTPPAINFAAGPSGGSRVFLDTGTMVFSIEDANGIDSVTYSLNGVPVGALTEISTDTYMLHFTLGKFGENNLSISAVDASYNHNRSLKSFSLEYNTVPSSIGNIMPPDNSTDIESIGGLKLCWSTSHDPDGDRITYLISYGTLSTDMQSLETSDTSILLNLQGGKRYLWSVRILSSNDTIRVPVNPESFFSFSTRNHPTTITGLDDITATINDTVGISVVASDREGIREYRWDFDGDGIIDKATNTGTTSFVTSPFATSNNLLLLTIDNMGAETTDTSKVNITNMKPIFESMNDTQHVGYNKNISLNAKASDDGSKLRYYWSFDGGITFTPVSNGDTLFRSSSVELPITYRYVAMVSDDDDNEVLDTQFVKCDWLVKRHEYNLDIWKRSNQTIFTHKNYLYLYGGERGNELPVSKNDLYRTVDGENWEKVVENMPCKAKIRAYSIISDGLLIRLIGGDSAKSYWSADDGITWTNGKGLVALNGFSYYGTNMSGASISTYVTPSGVRRYCLYGGKNGYDNNVDYETSWYISNGIDYFYDDHPVEGDIFSPRSFSAIVSSNDSTWLIGGDGGDKEVLIKCGDQNWQWSTITDNAEFPAFGQGYCVLFDGTMLLFSQEFNTVYYSKNSGKNWIEMKISHPFGFTEKVYGAVVLNGKIWVATNSALWETDDIP